MSLPPKKEAEGVSTGMNTFDPLSGDVDCDIIYNSPNPNSINLQQFNKLVMEQLSKYANPFLESSKKDFIEIKALKEKITDDLLLHNVLQDILVSSLKTDTANTEQIKKELQCNTVYSYVNQHILQMIDKLEEQAISILRPKEFQTVITDYVQYMFRTDVTDTTTMLDINIPPSKQIVQRKITAQQALDKASRAIEKAIGDINPQRVRNILEQKIDQDAADIFKDEMRTFKMLNEEEASNMRKLAFAMAVLRLNIPDETKYQSYINEVLTNLGLNVRLELPKTLTGGKKYKARTWKEWKASGGVSDPARAIIEKLLTSKLNILFEEEIKKNKTEWEQKIQIAIQQILNTQGQKTLQMSEDVLKSIEEFKFDGKKGSDAITALIQHLQSLEQEISEKTLAIDKATQAKLTAILAELETLKTTKTGEITGKTTEILDLFNKANELITSINKIPEATYTVLGIGHDLSDTITTGKSIKTVITELQGILQQENTRIESLKNSIDEQTATKGHIETLLTTGAPGSTDLLTTLTEYQKIIGDIGIALEQKASITTGKIESDLQAKLEFLVATIQSIQSIIQSGTISNYLSIKTNGTVDEDKSVLITKLKAIDNQVKLLGTQSQEIQAKLTTLKETIGNDTDTTGTSLYAVKYKITEDFRTLQEGISALTVQFQEFGNIVKALSERLSQNQALIQDQSATLEKNKTDIAGIQTSIASKTAEIARINIDEKLQPAIDDVIEKLNDYVKNPATQKTITDSVISKTNITPEALADNILNLFTSSDDKRKLLEVIGASLKKDGGGQIFKKRLLDVLELTEEKMAEIHSLHAKLYALINSFDGITIEEPNKPNIAQLLNPLEQRILTIKNDYQSAKLSTESPKEYNELISEITPYVPYKQLIAENIPKGLEQLTKIKEDPILDKKILSDSSSEAYKYTFITDYFKEETNILKTVFTYDKYTKEIGTFENELKERVLSIEQFPAFVKTLEDFVGAYIIEGNYDNEQLKQQVKQWITGQANINALHTALYDKFKTNLDKTNQILCNETNVLTTVEKENPLYKKCNSIKTQLEKYNKSIPSPTSIQFIQKDLLNYIDFVDSLFDVRTVVNFRTGGFNENYTDNKGNSTSYNVLASDNFRSLTELGKGAPITEYEEKPLSLKSINTFGIFTTTSKAKKYGPYYAVLNGGGGLNVEQDMSRLFARGKKIIERKEGEEIVPPINFIYSAYGYSGSGKSFSLLNNASKTGKPAIFQRILNYLKTNLTDQLGKEGITLKFLMYDYYGEVDDKQCPIPIDKITEASKKYEEITFFNYNESSQLFSHESLGINDNIQTQFNTYAQRNAYMCQNACSTGINQMIDVYNKLNTYRATTDFGNVTTDGQKFHIRMTPNNKESSRAHLFIDTYILKNEKTIGKITVMDMAGTEDVNTIQNNYFTKINKNIINVEAFKKRLEKSKSNFELKFKEAYANLNTGLARSSINDSYKMYSDSPLKTAEILAAVSTQTKKIREYVTTFKKANVLPFNTATDALKNPNIREFPFIEIDTDIFYTITKTIIDEINQNSWLKLWGYSFVDIHNKKLTPSLQILLETIIYNNYINYLKLLIPIINFRDEILKNFYTKKSNDIDTIENRVKSYYKTLLTNNEKQQLSEKHINEITDIFSAPVITFINNLNSTIASLYNECIEKILSAETFQSILQTSDLSQYNSVLNPDLLLPITNDSIKFAKPLINNNETFNRIINDFSQQVNTEVFSKIHCPLRYQGNFINQTLVVLNDYAKALATPGTTVSPSNLLKTNDGLTFCISTVLRDTLLNNDIYSSITAGEKLNRKLILMTNIRLDFNTEENTRLDNDIHKNFLNTLPIALEFSHCINPFKLTTTGYEQCAKAITGGNYPLLTGGDGKKEEVPAPPAPGAPMDPVTAVANAKEKLGELSDIKRDLNASLTAFENMEQKFKRFETFKETIETNKNPKDEPQQNAIIGAYNYMKEEGVALKEDFKKTIDSQKKALKTLQGKIVKILQSEPQTPIIQKMILNLVSTMEEKTKNKDSRGVYNDISAFYTNFETEFNDAFSNAKAAASAIQEQRKQLAEAQARGYGPGMYGYDSRHDRDRKDREALESKVRKLEAEKKQAAEGQNPQQEVVAKGGAPTPEESDKSDKSDKSETKEPNTNPTKPNAHVQMIKEGISEVLNNIVGELVKMYTRRINPTMSVFTSDSLFNRILNDYISNRNENNEAEVRDRFMSQLETNNLIPSKVLEVTQLDKIIFIFVTLFLRILCGSIVVSLIERGIIKTMTWAVAGYLILYTLILVAFVMIVNLDMYRMRIVFNYVNFHANAGKLYMHVLLLYILGVLIYIIMSRINLPVRNVTPKAISDNEKLRLIMRFQILTGILWVVLAIVVVLSSE
jgi:hypothetical protein